jgi:hypothetical protein
MGWYVPLLPPSQLVKHLDYVAVTLLIERCHVGPQLRLGLAILVCEEVVEPCCNGSP